MPKLRLCLLSIISFSLFSCGDYIDEEPIPENNASITFGIRHDKKLNDYELIATNEGEVSSSAYPLFAPIVKFCYTLDGSTGIEYIGTGTLVAPQWILTAGHNFFVADEQTSPAKTSGIQVFVGNDPNTIQQGLEVEKLVFHPTWLTDNDGYFYGNDLCLVKLKEPINSITPAKINLSKDERLSEIVWFGGFGDYTQQVGQDANLLPRKHALQNILDRKVDNIKTTITGKTYLGGLLAFDFDSPDGNVNSLGDNYVGEDEKALGTGTSDAMAQAYEGTTVEGDSGGPLFILTSEGWKIAGILSGGADMPIKDHKNSSYGDISIFIRTASSAEWLLSVIK
jgi:V8-like Glu-specific endopeptidase